jgi:hypothetical protein
MVNAKTKESAYKMLATEMARYRENEWERMGLFKQITLRLCDEHPAIACRILEEVENGNTQKIDGR